MNNPPKKGPERLPKLKNIPHIKFPVGKSSFGVKSVIYAIPSEKVDPTNIPAMKKNVPTPIADASKSLLTQMLGHLTQAYYIRPAFFLGDHLTYQVAIVTLLHQ